MLHTYGVTEDQLRGWTLGDFQRYRDFALQLLSARNPLGG